MKVSSVFLFTLRKSYFWLLWQFVKFLWYPFLLASPTFLSLNNFIYCDISLAVYVSLFFLHPQEQGFLQSFTIFCYVYSVRLMYIICTEVIISLIFYKHFLQLGLYLILQNWNIDEVFHLYKIKFFVSTLFIIWWFLNLLIKNLATKVMVLSNLGIEVNSLHWLYDFLKA